MRIANQNLILHEIDTSERVINKRARFTNSRFLWKIYRFENFTNFPFTSEQTSSVFSQFSLRFQFEFRNYLFYSPV